LVKGGTEINGKHFNHQKDRTLEGRLEKEDKGDALFLCNYYKLHKIK